MTFIIDKLATGGEEINSSINAPYLLYHKIFNVRGASHRCNYESRSYCYCSLQAA